MTNHLRRLIAAGFIAIALQAPAAMAQSILPGAVNAPPVPPEIQVPQGNTPFLKGHAVGTQNYICLPSGSTVSWRFFAPQATLFFTFQIFNHEVMQQVTTHFISPNPAEGGTLRPTWQSSLDTSSVWARPIGTTPSPGIVPAIPWLLLQMAGTQQGPTGGFFLAQTTFIQRLNTTGGLAPSSGCSEAGNVGATAFVPYTADYFFYKASK
jgi:hypothetical protein